MKRLMLEKDRHLNPCSAAAGDTSLRRDCYNVANFAIIWQTACFKEQLS
jgi:hypothetical protein